MLTSMQRKLLILTNVLIVFTMFKRNPLIIEIGPSKKIQKAH